MERNVEQQLQEQQLQREKQMAIDEQRRVLLRSVLSPEAQQRIARIHLVKPEKARLVENFVLQNAQRGAFQEQVSDEALVKIIERLGNATQTEERTGKVTIRRRRFDEDSDSDF